MLFCKVINLSCFHSVQKYHNFSFGHGISALLSQPKYESTQMQGKDNNQGWSQTSKSDHWRCQYCVSFEYTGQKFIKVMKLGDFLGHLFDIAISEHLWSLVQVLWKVWRNSVLFQKKCISSLSLYPLQVFILTLPSPFVFTTMSVFAIGKLNLIQ